MSERITGEAENMNCAQFAEIVHDLDRPGTGPGVEWSALRESALAHAESCSTCARLLTETQSLDFALHGLAARESRRTALPSLEAALVDEFRREKSGSARRRVRWQVVALGTAAAVLLALGFSLRHRSAPGPSTAPATNVAANVATNPSSSPVVSPVAAPGGSQRQERAPGSQSGDSEYATTFVPLPYADDPEGLDGGAVVRVELSREALASLGWPGAEPGGGAVTADVFVSADGTPQAIRPVSLESAGKSF